MSETEDEQPKKKGKGLLIGLVLALLLGGAGFYGVYSGMIPLPFGGGEDDHAKDAHGADQGDAHADGHDEAHGAPLPEPEEELPHAAFLPIEPVIVTIGRGVEARQLQLTAQLEVEPALESEAQLLVPRARDALNTYLRAVEPAYVEDPASMLKMRAQMLRRVQVVMGEGMIRDILVSEFVLR